MHTYIHTYMRIYIYRSSSSTQRLFTYTKCDGKARVGASSPCRCSSVECRKSSIHCVYVCMHVFLHSLCICIYIYIYIYICMHAFVCTSHCRRSHADCRKLPIHCIVYVLHACMHACVCVLLIILYIQCMHACVDEILYVCVYACNIHVFVVHSYTVFELNRRIHCVYIFIRVCLRVCACIHMYVWCVWHACMHVSLFFCMTFIYECRT
jgi:hypothetical protein